MPVQVAATLRRQYLWRCNANMHAAGAPLRLYPAEPTPTLKSKQTAKDSNPPQTILPRCYNALATVRPRVPTPHPPSPPHAPRPLPATPHPPPHPAPRAAPHQPPNVGPRCHQRRNHLPPAPRSTPEATCAVRTSIKSLPESTAHAYMRHGPRRGRLVSSCYPICMLFGVLSCTSRQLHCNTGACPCTLVELGMYGC